MQRNREAEVDIKERTCRYVRASSRALHARWRCQGTRAICKQKLWMCACVCALSPNFYCCEIGNNQERTVSCRKWKYVTRLTSCLPPCHRIHRWQIKRFMPLLSATLQQPVMRRAVVRRALTNSQNHWLSNLPRPARVAGAAAAAHN